MRSISISGSGVFTDSTAEETVRGYAMNNSIHNYELNRHSHFRYYINKHTNHRIRGDRLETIVFDAIHYACMGPRYLQECFNGEYAMLSEEEGLYRLQSLWANWNGMTEKEKHQIGQKVIDKVTILPKSVNIRIGYDGLNHLLKELKSTPAESNSKLPDIANEPSVVVYDDVLEITVPVIFKKTGKTSQALSSNGKAFEVFKISDIESKVDRCLNRYASYLEPNLIKVLQDIERSSFITYGRLALALERADRELNVSNRCFGWGAHGEDDFVNAVKSLGQYLLENRNEFNGMPRIVDVIDLKHEDKIQALRQLIPVEEAETQVANVE